MKSMFIEDTVLTIIDSKAGSATTRYYVIQSRKELAL